MKVKIGKYVNYIGPYQIAETLFFWTEHKYKIAFWLAENKDGSDSILTNLCNWIYSKRKRTIKVVLDPWDTWDLDSTLAYIIAPALKQLKTHKISATYVDDEDVPEELRSTSCAPKKTEWETDDNHFKRWDWVLDEMIWSFENHIQQYEVEYEKEDYDRKKNGFRLFGKYYANLWD